MSGQQQRMRIAIAVSAVPDHASAWSHVLCPATICPSVRATLPLFDLSRELATHHFVGLLQGPREKTEGAWMEVVYV
jgi:hypothetical protein